MRNHHSKTLAFLSAALLVAVVAAACSPGDPFRSTGSYPIDIFQEMHYNQTQKAQEPPRFLPPEDSYPVSGGFIAVRDIEGIDEAENPMAGDANAVRRGALLFKQNCSSCHGDTAGGNGKVGAILATYGVTRPPAFGSGGGVIAIRETVTNELTPGKAFKSVSGGVGFMPSFEGLLSEDDRWSLVTLIDLTVAEREAALQGVNDIPEEERTLELLRLRGQL